MDNSTASFLRAFAGALYDTALNEASKAEAINQRQHRDLELINRHLVAGNLCVHIADAIRKALDHVGK